MQSILTQSSGKILGGLALAGAVLAAAVTARAERFAEQPWGYDTPAERCVVCHSLEKGGPFRVAPNLWGIVGAQKGRDREWFSYSPALIKMGGTWTEDELDAFLADASAFMPGSSKTIRVKDEQERKDIIDFLKSLSD